jgi:hypothetical protein
MLLSEKHNVEQKWKNKFKFCQDLCPADTIKIILPFSQHTGDKRCNGILIISRIQS